MCGETRCKSYVTRTFVVQLKVTQKFVRGTCLAKKIVTAPSSLVFTIVTSVSGRITALTSIGKNGTNISISERISMRINLMLMQCFFFFT